MLLCQRRYALGFVVAVLSTIDVTEDVLGVFSHHWEVMDDSK